MAVTNKITGPKISEYAVQDKQQVADIDPSMLIDDEYTFEEDDGSYDACMVCDEFGEASQLMYCHSCEQLCHVFCAGLDRMPSRGPWYCHGCVENPGLLEAAAQRRPAARSPAAWINGRSRVPRHNRAPDEWVGVWQSVWDRLQFDIEFPFEDDDQSENQSDVLRRDNHLWERRFALAQQVGAGTRFRAAADNIHARRRDSNLSSRPTNRTLHRDPPKSPKDPESQEELRAWNQFEKAREQLAQAEGQAAPDAPSNTSSRRGRKRKSVDSSPAESEPREHIPERKLKRPRTRLHTDNGESSSAAARRNTIISANPPATASSPPAATTGETSATPGFLQSLLQEVEVDRFAERDKEIAAPQPRRVIVERACSPQNSSPGLSPVYPKPPGMTTPPPLNLGLAKSAQQDDQISPTYSPFSPADDDRRGRKLPHRSAGLSSPPRSKDSSPTRSLSYSTKAELQRMVTAVLKPLYAKKEVTKEEYTEINRDISRLLYEKVGEAGADALADQDTREKWQNMANTEVDTALKTLRTSVAAALSPVTEDSASSSS